MGPDSRAQLRTRSGRRKSKKQRAAISPACAGRRIATPPSSRASEARPGTHNPRELFGGTPWPHRANHYHLWVWVPIFVGTTKEKSKNQSRAPPSLPVMLRSREAASRSTTAISRAAHPSRRAQERAPQDDGSDMSVHVKKTSLQTCQNPPRRAPPELCQPHRATEIRGRRECRVPGAPAAPCATKKHRGSRHR
jgi:hypothetical protein